MKTYGPISIIRKYMSSGVWKTTEREVINANGTIIPSFQSGNEYFVSSVLGSATGSALNWEESLSTLDAAIAKCTANNGDIIWVGPGHAEAISAAAGIVFDVAGITVIGVGLGSLMPTITLNTIVSADIDVTAANVAISNIRFSANFADIAVCIDLDAKNFTLEDCEFLDTAVDMDFVVYIDCDDTANACDGLTVRNCTVISPDVANDHFIAAVGDIDRLTVEGCFIMMGVNDGEAIIEASTGKDFTNCLIRHNAFNRGNTANVMCMESDTTANSGMIYDNYVGHLDSASAVPFDVTGAKLFQNFAVGVVDKSGLLLPAADDNA